MLAFKIRLLLLFILAISLSANAQQLGPIIGIKSLLSQVESHAPMLQSDSVLIGIRQAQEKEARSNWLPDLNLNYQANVGSNKMLQVLTIVLVWFHPTPGELGLRVINMLL